MLVAKASLREKLTAMSVHLALSALILGSVIAGFWSLYYPGVFFELTGVIEPIKLMIVVDLVIGPLLTFIVYRKGKSSLKFDLTCIGLVQLAAIAYGTHILIQERPGYLVYAFNKFTLVSLQDIDQKKIENAQMKLSVLDAPKVVLLQLPPDPNVMRSLMIEELVNKESVITAHPEYFIPIDGHGDVVMKGVLNKDQVIKTFHSDEQSRRLASSDKLALFKVDGRKNTFVLALDTTTLQPKAILPIAPN